MEKNKFNAIQIIHSYGWAASALLIAVSAVLIGVSIVWIDRPLALLMKNNADTLPVHLAAYVTDAGKAWLWLLLAALTLVLAKVIWRRTRLVYQSAFVFICVATSGIAADLIK